MGLFGGRFTLSKRTRGEEEEEGNKALDLTPSGAEALYYDEDELVEASQRARQRRRASCIRAGELFLQQLEHECSQDPACSSGRELAKHCDEDEGVYSRVGSSTTCINACAVQTPMGCVGISAPGEIALPSLRKLRMMGSETEEKMNRRRGNPSSQAGTNEDENGDDVYDEEEEDGEFRIRCSQSYERHKHSATTSPCPWTPTPPESSTMHDDELENDPDGDELHTDEDTKEGCKDEELDGEDNECQGNSVGKAIALSTEQVVVGSENGMKTPNYSIFRSLSERKTIHIVRHGESLYNAMDHYGLSFADPFIFDAALTELGRHQAMAVGRGALKSLDLPPDALWVTSPLTRAIQTMLTAYAQYSKQTSNKRAIVLEGTSSGRGSGADGDSGGGKRRKLGENISEKENQCYLEEKCQTQQRRPDMAVCSHLAEHLCTTGDVGRPKSELIKAFPKIEEELSALPENWWWSPPDKPNDAMSKTFSCREPKKHLRSRVGLFREWVLKQPHRVIVAFGHSTFWKEFTGSSTRLKNGEIHTIVM